MSAEPPITEGSIPYSVPTITKPCVTWYKIIGSLSSLITPLIIIHGGPGLSHEYLLCLTELNKRFGIPLIFYDQIGTGLSTHLPEKNGDEAFWSDDIFINELLNLTKALRLDEREGGYDVLGHSWGGMLGAVFAAAQPPGLRKLIISNSPATSRLWASAYRGYREEMPDDVKEVLYWDGEKLESEEYEKALMVFYKKHMCSVDPWPEEFVRSFDWVKKDGTVALTMLGPSEFESGGSQRDWSAVEAVKNIKAETLVINGEEEGASDEAVRPFVEGINGAEWVKLKGTRHMPMYEDPEAYWHLVGSFLLKTAPLAL